MRKISMYTMQHLRRAAKLSDLVRDDHGIASTLDTMRPATSIVETLSPPPRGNDEARAANILVRAGAQFIDEALAANPDGPVQMHTELARTDVTYDVTIGDPSDSMSPRTAHCIWHRVVVFGHTDRTVAGGAAFVEAARMQEAVAWAALDLLEARR